ncbi:hypothetical protein K438DRAFT_1984691 [Mycena galopus ATCC 62051]|nr:hypothetical protein K438DRAFT_1984691 [Mycena galopus ATCC 62051]
MSSPSVPPKTAPISQRKRPAAPTPQPQTLSIPQRKQPIASVSQVQPAPRSCSFEWEMPLAAALRTLVVIPGIALVASSASLDPEYHSHLLFAFPTPADRIIEHGHLLPAPCHDVLLRHYSSLAYRGRI